jgi:ABC-type transporter Mla MlaB component
MRRHGVVDSASGLGLHGHACWTYGDEGEFRSGVFDFLVDGLELGQRLLYVGPGGVEKLRRDVEDIPGLESLLADGTMRIMPLEAAYEIGKPIDPVAQLTMYAAACQTALADGFAGLRVAADVTPLVAEPEFWDAHVHWEAVADRYAARHPLAGLCCYDRRALPDRIVHDLACVHRTAHGPDRIVPFHLFAGREGLALAGEVDSFAADDLLRLLRLAAPQEGPLVLELDELAFIDHHGVLAIAKLAEELTNDGRWLSVRGAPHSFDRLVELLRVEL